MDRYHVAHQIPPPRLADDTATGGWARWVRDRWQAVRVTHLKTVPLHPDVPGRLRVRVNVYLGALAPADVLVEATADRAETDGARAVEAPDEWPIRLCSMQSYRNGTYVFEALLPRQAVEQRRRLTVRVRPGARHEALSTLRDVVRLFEFSSGPARALLKARRSLPEPAAVND
jgi:hypothetical protein